ncbi:MAG TPA: hypothetical protein VM537_12275 [Anaerolineae bacterium]|nr:hypothetical protein [Anaerolineae bacterium]
MPSNAVAAPRTEAADEVVMAAVAVRRRATDAVRLTIKALRELNAEIDALVQARDGKGGSDGH